MTYVTSSAVFAVQLRTPPDDTGPKLLTSHQPEWILRAECRLSELMRLNRGWDGYNGKPLAPATAYFAMSLLLQVCSDKSSSPFLVPTSSGGVQIEWHRGGRSLEILVRKPNHVEVWYSDENGEEREQHLMYRFSALEPIVRTFDVD